jgi:non-ribosomal peptide synthetase component F
MIGLLINMVPVWLRIDPAEHLITLLTRLQNQQSELSSHQHLALTQIQRLAGINNLFDTAMVVENYPLDAYDQPPPSTNVRITDITGRDATHYPLTLIVCPTPRLRLRVDYVSDLFDRSSIQALADRLMRLLDAVIANPHQPVGRINILSGAERRQLLIEYNTISPPIPVDCLPVLFETQVAHAPDATAVVCGDVTVTYAKLNTRANQLAYALIARGVGPEQIVALAMPRGVDLVVAMVGVLKAGAAYLPVDPDYPPARIDFMLRDAHPALLLTTSDTTASTPWDTTASAKSSFSWSAGVRQGEVDPMRDVGWLGQCW